MPRRRGISNKQRSAQSVKQQQQQQQQRQIQEIILRKKAEQEQQEQQQRRRKTESDAPAVCNGVQRTISAITNHVINQDGGAGRYLHKKFKKVVEVEEAAAAPPAPTPGVAALAAPAPVNGHPPPAPAAPTAAPGPGDTTAATPEGGPGAGAGAGAGKEEAGAGRHVCPYCNMACAKPSVLEKHIRAHTNERPYPCEPCGFRFKTMSNLYKHQRSHTHTRKMEEVGANPSLYPQLLIGPDDEAGSSDGREDGAPPPPAATPSSALPGQQPEHPEPVRNIYKPKFHPAAFQYNEEKENGDRRPASVSSESGPGPGLGPGPEGQSTPGLGFGLGPRQSSTPSPETLQRHISKLILENKAIVDAADPLWAKKYSQRISSSNSPAGSTASSPAPSPAPAPAPPQASATAADSPSPSSVLHKKFLYRQFSGEMDSRLALALTGHKQTPPPTATPPPPPPQAPSPLLVRGALSAPAGPDSSADAEAPLNLSKPVPLVRDGTLDLTQPHKRHSPHQPAPAPAPAPPPTVHQQPHQFHLLHQPSYPPHQLLHHQMQPHQLASHHQMHQPAHQLKSHHLHHLPPATTAPEPDSAFKRVSAGYGVDAHGPHASVDGSVIKDILLKSRAAAAAGLYLPTVDTGTYPMLPPYQPEVRPEDATYLVPPGTAYQCPSCKTPCRSPDALRKHVMYCSKTSFTQPRVPSRPPSAEVSPRAVVPPQPSPGPLLGNTPLVDSYNALPVKRRRLDSGGAGPGPGPGPGPEQLQAPRASPRASPRSLTSPSSFPAAPAPGPTTPAPPPSPLPATLRSLEELSRSPHRSNSLQMFGGQVQILDNAAGEPTTLRIEPSGLNMSGDKVGAEGVAVSSTGAGASPQQMVVTIAKSGLQTGGGTIVQQVPASAAPADSSSAADHKGKSAYMGVNSGSGPSVADATHLVIPFIPNIATPNLAIKGIPAPSHLPLHPMGYSALAMNSLSHHVAMGHPLPMGDPLLNPLTSITAFNPLTLAAQPPPTLSRPPRPVQPPASSPLHSGASTVTSSSSSTFYGGNVLTIVCDGRAIPHVPGMPGPASQLHAPAAATPAVSTGAGPGHFGPAPVLAASAPTPAASPVYKRPAAPPPPKESVRAKQAPSLTSLPPGQDRAGRSPTPTLASPVPSPVPSSAPAAPSPPRVEKRNFSMFSAEAMRRSEAPGEVSPSPSLPSIRVESAPAPLPGPQAPDESSLSRLKRLGSSSLTDERDDSSEKRMRLTPLNPEAGEDKDDKDMSKNAVTEATRGNRFLRPTSLPLKPGTFTPKRHLITPNVLSLVSPETPRPKKSYGQLYLNGHAYTYLGLKCSTRPYFCTLNRLQPTYVPLSPDHNKLSMYSNWKVYDPDPDPCGLTPNQMIALYDSRHRPTEYSVSGSKTNVRVTHSSYWLTRVKNEPDAALDVSEDGTNAPKRIKICAGGFESSEEYTYIRGRGRGRYVCEECGIRCKKPSMLKKHIRTHTDVRPFTCRHCSFSFKTKGNLTKHMKSKAHYKKCKEEGIDPVPTVVDDSYIDEACLARQQAMRDEAGVEDEDSDDDEDEEDDDAEEDDDDDEDEAEADIKGRQEREAAKSLLSLAQTPHHSPNNDRATEKEAREAGLVAPKGARGLSTYPYQLSTEHPRRITSSIPGTPTLAAISEHKEREKVSHNTGLARDIHEQGIHVEDGAKPLAELNTEDGHQRYYFPSSRIVGGSSSLPTDTIKQESKDVDGADSTNSDDTSSKFKGISGRIPTALLTALPSTLMPRTPTTPISEILTPVSEPAFLLASLCSTMEKLPVSLATPTDPPEDSALHQTYLRERAVQDARVKQSQYHPRSRGERSEDTSAVILGTPTSCITPTMSYSNALSHTDTVRTVMCSATFTSVSHLISSQSGITAQESTMLRPPPLFWAAQTTSKVNDSDPRLVTSSNVKVSASLSTSGTSALPSNLTSTAPPVSVKQENVLSPVKVVPTPLTIQSSSTVELSDKRTRTISGTDCASDKILLGDQTNVEAIAEIKPESFQSPPVTCGDKLNATLSVITTVSASGNDASSAIPFTEEAGSTVNSTGSRSSTTNSVIVANSGSTSPPQTSGAVVKKPKAEFMPPSSGPAPSYVSVTDDGRSKCTICNKVFSKPSQLHLHVNIHYFERPYRCDSCVVSFRTQGHLQKHQRSVSHHNKVSMNSTFGTPTTTNPRPYKCDDCKVAFRIHGHLAKHLRSKMHIMKLECVGKLPFGTYAEIERAGLNMNDIDTTDCDSSLESLLALAKKLCEKDPTKLNQWKQPEPTASDIDESSDEGEPILFHGIPFPDVVDTGDEDNATTNTPQSDASHQNQQQPPPPQSVQQLHHNQHQHLPPRISSPNQTPSLQQSGASSSAVKQDGGAPRTNTTAAAAAAAAVAAAAAAASAPASRVFPGISAGNQSAPPPPGSNGVPTYMPATIKMDVQSSDKAPILTHLPGMMAGRYNSVNSHSIIHNSKDVNPEIKSASLDRRIVHLEQTHDLQDKTVDSRTGVCEVPNKTDIAYGGQSLQPPANR